MRCGVNKAKLDLHHTILFGRESQRSNKYTERESYKRRYFWQAFTETHQHDSVMRPTEHAIVALLQWFPKYGRRPKQGSRRVKVRSRRGDPNLSCTFSTFVFFPFFPNSCDLFHQRLNCCIRRVVCWHWTSQLTAKTRSCIHYVIHVETRCLRLGSRGVHQTHAWVALKKVWEPLSWLVCYPGKFYHPHRCHHRCCKLHSLSGSSFHFVFSRFRLKSKYK